MTDKGATKDEAQTVTLPRHLTITYGVSRGRETEGYGIVRLRDGETGRTYRTMGGGYDMIGTVLADWLQDVAQDQLRAIAPARAYYIGTTAREGGDTLYGMRYRPDGSVSLDGACGVNSIERIAWAVGIVLKWEGNRRGTTTGYLAVAQ